MYAFSGELLGVAGFGDLGLDWVACSGLSLVVVGKRECWVWRMVEGRRERERERERREERKTKRERRGRERKDTVKGRS